MDEQLQPGADPALSEIACLIPVAAAYQITRTAERLSFTHDSEVLTTVADAIVRKTASPIGATMPALAGSSFPPRRWRHAPAGAPR